jgi:hypothetical protein
LIPLLTFGCGGDEETPDQEEPMGNDLVGSWEIVTIDGKSLDEYFSLPGDGIQIKITHNEAVFASAGWWAESYTIEFVGDLGDGVSITLSMSASAKGKYTVSGTRLSLVLEDVSVTLTPLEVWESLGTTEESAEQEIRKEILDSGTWSVSGTTLTFLDDDGTITAFRKKEK